ncbi:hypothetical protein [Nostoc mirabile]|nr:hypothetical protein [Nostoc mirabile]
MQQQDQPPPIAYKNVGRSLKATVNCLQRDRAGGGLTPPVGEHQ